VAENVIGNRPDAVLFQMSASEKKTKTFSNNKRGTEKKKNIYKRSEDESKTRRSI
jgi:hypothetical protein